jgi:2-polyprenyl-6-methoxyphenol hydroxylase-like FAD-dependent oxidoreductase
MSKDGFRVLIIGGGLGGLCLAQGLQRAGIEAQVYERDQAATSRAQGFRIHIDPQGSRALHQCLPPHLWRIFDATGGDFSQGFTVVSEQLQELLTLFDERERMSDPVARHRSVSRITLREILLAGLRATVYFGKRFVSYEEMQDGRLLAHFDDGSTAVGDVLIGADGVNSRVRQQYLPQLDPVDTGVLAIAARISLSDGVMALAPARLLDGPVMLMPSEPCSLFMAMWKRSSEAQQYLRQLGIEEVSAGDDNYLLLGLGGRADFLRIDGDADALKGTTLKNVLRRTVARWHPDVRKLVEMADESQISLSRLRSSAVPTAWKATRVTLLGDAIHSMTPYRGIGANIALRDAGLLATRLTEVADSSKSIVRAIAEYEAEMREYAFAAVRSSLRAMEQAVGEKRNPGFALVKNAMRVVNAVPILKRRLIPA